MVIYRTLLLVTLVTTFGCASLEAPKEDTESWKTSWKNRAEKMGMEINEPDVTEPEDLDSKES